MLIDPDGAHQVRTCFPMLCLFSKSFAHYQVMRSYVLGVCFDKTGKKLASCSADKTIMVWDPTTGEPIGSPLAGHSDE